MVRIFQEYSAKVHIDVYNKEAPHIIHARIAQW